MSFIGQDQRPAPKVKEVRLSQEEMTSAYQQCIEVGEVRGGGVEEGKGGGVEGTFAHLKNIFSSLGYTAFVGLDAYMYHLFAPPPLFLFSQFPPSTCIFLREAYMYMYTCK